MKTRLFTSVTIIILLGMTLSACGPSSPADGGSSSQQGTITISGAWALYPLVIRWSEEYQALNPGVRFDISAGGAGKGMADVLAGAVDIGMVSREIYPQETEGGAVGYAVAKDAVFLTVNSQNPMLEQLMATGVTQQALIDIYIAGQITSWEALAGLEGEDNPIHVFTRSDACGAAETWANYLGGKQEDLLGIGVYGDPGVLESVLSDYLAMGFNNLNYAYDYDSGLPVIGVQVLPLDVNGNGKADPEEILDTKEHALNAVGAGWYPSPPARDLFLVTRGVPEGLAGDFLLWVLTAGQAYLGETGYIPVSPEKLENQIQGLGG